MHIDQDAVKHLPALAIAGQANEQLKEHNRLIITAAPGAGKSTLLPLTLLQGLTTGGKILMLEPRRLAARQIAERMAALIGEPVGQTVGYRVRFEKRAGAQTRIEVLTEGILTRMLVNDPMLEGVDMVVFDEFHERSLTLDVALALTREAQQVVRPDLKIVIMSATIDTTALNRELDAPVVESEGRMFPVDIQQAEDDCTPQNVAEQVALAVKRAHQQHQGDILAFLPGQAEITRCQELLEGALGSTRILPLYGQLAAQEQRQAIAPSREGERKVVLATDIAETSLTIEGVRVVVDSGLARTLVFDPQSGLSRLETVRISADRATQRAGRAGRVAPGTCLRLFTLATAHRMAENRQPEIATADLTPMALDVSAWGESDAARLPWLTPPPAGNLAQAYRLLQLLGATEANGKITALGKKMSALPCHPRMARMLLLEEDPKTKALAADIAALLEEKDPMADALNDADINTRIAQLRTARARRNEGKWSRIARIAREYRQLARSEEDNEAPDAYETGRLIATAYPERVAMATNGVGHYRLAGGDKACVQNADALSAGDWLAIATLNAASGKVFLASPLKPETIGHLVSEKANISWDAKQGLLLAQQERKIGNLLLQARPLKNLDRQLAIETLCKAAEKDGLGMLDFAADDAQALQRRVACVAAWHPELGLPELSAEAVLPRAQEWLPFYLERNGQLLTTAAELKKIDLKQALLGLLTYEQQQEVERLAPSHITVPTGSRIRVDYRQGAEAPVLSVRLQECFGLTDTPTVDGGRLPVLMELLSPGYKPVQLTRDLRSFWSGTYFEVRKELRRRYPKHSWPENPLEAEAVRGVKKKG